MKRATAMLATLLAMVPASGLGVSAADAVSGELRHAVGEPLSEFLRAEPAAQRQVDMCRRHLELAGCTRLIAALQLGQRAEISISRSGQFVVDGGKVVRFTTALNAGTDAAVLHLSKKFGGEMRIQLIHAGNGQGAKWENHLYVWETSTLWVTLYEDNDPARKDQRPLLMVEAKAAAGDFTVSVQQLKASGNGE